MIQNYFTHVTFSCLLVVSDTLYHFVCLCQKLSVLTKLQNLFTITVFTLLYLLSFTQIHCHELMHSKWEGFSDLIIHHLKKYEMMIFVFDRVENIVGKGEITYYQHFLLFPQRFKRLLIEGR